MAIRKKKTPDPDALRDRALTKALIRKLAKGGPAPDDPYLRHKKLSADRVVGVAEPQTLADRRVAALQRRGEMPPPPAPPVGGASNWVQLGPMAIPNGQTYSPARVLVTGRISAIAIDRSALDPATPATIYIGSAKGGIWKTTDGGKSWAPKSDQEASLAVGAIALDPTDPQVVYAGTGEGNLYYLQGFTDQMQFSYYGAGLLKSTNGGATWTRLGIPQFTGAAFFRIAIHPAAPNRIWAATSHGLFRSTDRGTTWSLVTGGGLPVTDPATLSGCSDIALHPTNPSVVYAGFWGSGLYQSMDATTPTPRWTTMPGLPMATGRVSVAVSPSSPDRVIAALSGAFWSSADGGLSWLSTGITAPGCNTEFYCANVAIDPATPDIVYVCGYPELWKLTRDPASGAWSGGNTGATIHPDHHSFAFDPLDHLTVYSGNDGGIYRSTDGGTTWSDSINRGLCLTMFEFLDQHPTSDAVVFSGTQDNGTEQYRNSPVFHHADDGDGGFVVIDPVDPRNVIHEYFNISPIRSQLGGAYGTFTQSLGTGLSGSSLFYPPFTLCAENANWIAFGAQQLFIDKAQGTGGWPTAITLPGATGVISAINFLSRTLIYCATNRGEVYAVRSADGGVTWTPTPLHAAPLPHRFVWDIAVQPGNVSRIVAVVSGFGTGHVWRGVVPATGAATWTDISGSGTTGVPDIPANAVVIDPTAPATYYVGTDVGVFRTTDGGVTWGDFGHGLPNSSVYDLRLHATQRLLRAATNGRGMWERKLDATSMPDVDLYVRHNLMDSGRGSSAAGVTAAFADPLQQVALGDPLYPWMCADIKVDALAGSPLAYQFPVADVDFVTYEARLEHRNAERGNVNRVYVQVHNRGIATATSVTVKLLYADASAGLPPLPADFWTAFPGNSAVASSPWHPIGAAKTTTVTPTLPAVLEWDWTTPVGQATHSCLLAVIDGPSNPIPAANKLFDVDALVVAEKRVGLKNLHIVDVPAAAAGAAISGAALLRLFGSAQRVNVLEVRPLGTTRPVFSFLLPRIAAPPAGVTSKRPTRAQLDVLLRKLGAVMLAQFDLERLYTLSGAWPALALPKAGLPLAILLSATHDPAQPPSRFQVIQRRGNAITGGSTFVLRAR
jgi:photosystem II stability/assembly factor-like uncharacterized protein